jgi:twitching motility protein PilT
MSQMDVTDLLGFAVKNKASDIHISAGLPPMVRINGQMRPVNVPALSKEVVHAMIYDIMNDAQRKWYEENLEIDFAIDVPQVARFRVNAFQQDRGPAAAFRTIPAKVLSLEDLNAPAIFKDIIDVPRGLVLVTGPTGSGKSTTLAAMVNHLNNHRQDHIITIEDPIEFLHTPNRCLINQREVGPNTKSFENALRSALREDPDVILVGELRDLQTMRLALTAAETGHVVFGTLHTSSAPKTIDRIIDSFPGGEKDMVRSMLSESLRAVVAQTLIPTADRRGRVAAHEIMIANPAIRNLIRENKVAQMYSVIQTGQNQGMQTLDQCLLNLVRAHTISREDAVRRAQNKDSFANVA